MEFETSGVLNTDPYIHGLTWSISMDDSFVTVAQS